MSGLLVLLLVIVPVSSKYGGSWLCGDTEIPGDSECMCGGHRTFLPPINFKITCKNWGLYLKI